MKHSGPLPFIAFAFILTGMGQSAHAATWYWDTGVGLGNGVGGTGNLTSTGATWSTTSTGDATLTTGSSTALAANDLIFQGTAGTVTLSSTSVGMNTMAVITTGYTFANNSATGNRYLNVSNGITLGNGVTLNLTGAQGTGTGAGVLGIMGTITNAVGASGYGTIAITGNSGTTAGAGIRIGSRTTNSGSGSVDWWANLNVQTTGTSGAFLHTMDSGSTNRIRGGITVANGSKLTISPGASGSRSIIVYGDILTSADNALVIGESSNLGLVELRGNNTITGDLNVYGQLGYRSKTALGTSRVVLNVGSTLGQSGAIGGDTAAERTIDNNILMAGGAWTAGTMVTLGGLGSGNYFNGNIDLNGQSRLIRVDNATVFNGGFINGTGLTLTNASTSANGRSLTLNGASTYSGDTTFVSSGTGWNVTTGNTTGSAFGSGDVVFNNGASTNTVSTLAGSGIISGTVRGNGLITAGNATGAGAGLLTLGRLDPTSNQAYAFELNSRTLFSGLTYNNDVIRTTLAGGPFTANLSSANVVDIFLSSNALTELSSAGGDYLFGFFSATDFASQIGSGTFNVWVVSATGAKTFNGLLYDSYATYAAANGFNSTYTVGTASTSLADGTLGYMTTLNIPEPSSSTLMALGLAGLVGLRALRRKL